MNWQGKLEVRNKFKSFLFEKIILPFNRYRGLFGFKIENKIPRIIIHEKFKNAVKWLTRFLIFVGIFSSVIYIPIWYLSLIFSLSLFGFQWILEKAILRFTTIFITPLPNFTWNEKEWNGMGYMYTNDLKSPSFFGPSFVSKDFGIKAFNLLLSWNYNSHYDDKGNICISFVEEETNNYRVYFYPSEKRRTLVEFEQGIKEAEEHKNKDHHSLIVQMIMCQSFPLNLASNYFKWKELFLNNQPTCLGVFTYDTGSRITEPIREITPIRVHKINFKKRKELSKKDIEYIHGKYTIGI